ncbi:hypothetical protein BKA67DRAFT_532692 [Truncatella angustata]|uniref:Zn(2)-C6 fungal-type domain-containing protein n=1 Tax=Truncatella angustata TaxID=152316 RepID=A0A9P9A0W0_9PEZI|nr:uncharacterized protein BKA67DRAFT_532692 [Truncatella angustata]KAH6657484.1 hypothetical protein BKA67DRAFT_532692 [Truncatella angustata]KAH8199333.1 hypothetical protein TruAng_006518 [Truncatella angustata]
MGNHGNLPQLVEQVQHVIRQVQKPRLLQDPGAVSFNLPSPSSLLYSLEVSEPGDESICEDFFDWALWGTDQVEKAQSGTKSEDSSMPGLTSATTPPPSEKGGAPPSPREVEDRTQHKDKLKEARRADDSYTFPQRELRPKADYVSQISLSTAVQHVLVARPGLIRSTRESSLPSPPSSPRSSSDRNGPPNSSRLSRGKRVGPLKNGDEVADVRALGACICCRIRKVKCDDHEVCGTCADRASKPSLWLEGITGQQICFRNPFADNQLLFPQISKTEANRQPVVCRPTPVDFINDIRVFFRSNTDVRQALLLQTVLKDGRLAGNERESNNYKLNIDEQPDGSKLQDWAEHHMNSVGITDFQSALDLFVLKYAKQSTNLPQHDLLRKVHKMRCLYKVWSQKDFVFLENPSTPVRVLPKALQTGLRNLAKFGLKRLEGEVFALLDKSLWMNGAKVNEQDRMGLWVSVMQLILMYRDIFGKTMAASNIPPSHAYYRSACQLRKLSVRLFSALVVICEVASFGKKPLAFDLEVPGTDAVQTARRFMNNCLPLLERHRDEFFESVEHRPDLLDKLLLSLRGRSPKKGQTAKRQKTTK